MPFLQWKDAQLKQLLSRLMMESEPSNSSKLNRFQGAFVWDQSRIRIIIIIIGIMRVCVFFLGAFLIPEYLDFNSAYSASRSRIAGIYPRIYSYSGINQTNAPLESQLGRPVGYAQVQLRSQTLYKSRLGESAGLGITEFQFLHTNHLAALLFNQLWVVQFSSLRYQTKHRVISYGLL